MSDPLVSFCITAYNRYEQLKECIDSFFKTCMYDNIELVVTDNASPDERIKEYLRTLNVSNVSDYKLITRKENTGVLSRQQARLEARRVVSGEYIIDCPDDHLFVVKSDWIRECLTHIEYYESLQAIDQSSSRVGCVIYYAQPAYRFAKSNNESCDASHHPHVFRESLHKGYADYHVMSMSTYREIGEFDATATTVGGVGYGIESEYMSRSHAKGFRRHLLKVPASIINEPMMNLVSSVSDAALYHDFAETLKSRSISNEELTTYLLRKGHVRPAIIAESKDVFLDKWLA